MKLRLWSITFLALAGVGLSVLPAAAQSPSTLYAFPAGTADWFKNFGTGTGTLGNSGGALTITETSATPGTGAAWSDGFNTISDQAPFTSGCCGGLDLYGLTSLSLDFGHNGAGPVNVQFFAQASSGSNYVVLNPGGTDIAAGAATTTYTFPLSVLTSPDQVGYIRTIGVTIRDHTALGNLTFTLDNIKSNGPGAASRVIADHDGGAADFDGVICNFDCGAIGGGNGGQNNSGMSVVGNALQWTDLGGGPGAAVTWGNGTQNSGGGFSARPVDLSNYNYAIVRMSATGTDPSVFVQFYMQTGSGFSFQAVNVGNLPTDGQFHDLLIPLSSITGRNWVDTNGINLGGHAGDAVIRVDSVIYSSVPEPASMMLLGIGMIGGCGMVRRGRQVC